MPYGGKPVITLEKRIAELMPRAVTVAAHAPITVPCSTCHAQPGEPCRSRGNGWTPRNGFHAPRIKAVADLTEVEKVEAVARMQLAEERRRSEASAEMRWREQNPAYVAERNATRARISAAWAQIDANVREREQHCADVYLHSGDCRCREPGWTPPAPRTPTPVGVAEVADLAAERAARRGR